MKSRGGKSQRREEKRRRKKIKTERVSKKKIQVREKVAKSRNTVFFQLFVAPEGRKVGSLKRRCGASWPDERWKIARRCGAKQISKSKCTKHTRFGALLEVEMSNKCTPLWREAHFEVKMHKAHPRGNFHSRTGWLVHSLNEILNVLEFKNWSQVSHFYCWGVGLSNLLAREILMIF